MLYEMNVLSLFDGMSCGQIALKELGITVDNYFASEIDKFAIAQTQLNFPNTIQLGSVVDVNVKKLPKIDLLMGGSPCQSFSFAGKRNGMSTTCNEEIFTLDRYLELKYQNFEFKGESYLFWEYMRILTDIRKYNNPDVKFLLENVEMGKKWERVLSKAIGIFGVHVNSSLVSAQNRKRIYWSNIRTRKEGLFGDLHTDIPQPDDCGILLKDILELESEINDKYYIKSKHMIDFVTDGKRIEKKYTQINGLKALPQMARQYASWNGDFICHDNIETGIIIHSTMPRSSKSGKGGTGRLSRRDGKTYCLSTQQSNVIQLNQSTESNGNQPQQQNRVYDANGKSHAHMAQMSRNSYSVKTEKRIRRLTPTECARLQTVPEWYKWKCSDTQQYKMLGNGWTIKVIMHILKYLK